MQLIRIYTCSYAGIAGYAGAYPAYPVAPPLGIVGLEVNNVELGVGDGAENNNMQIDGENPSQGATKKRK